jgi:hypothetical protein
MTFIGPYWNDSWLMKAAKVIVDGNFLDQYAWDNLSDNGTHNAWWNFATWED